MINKEINIQDPTPEVFQNILIALQNKNSEAEQLKAELKSAISIIDKLKDQVKLLTNIVFGKKSEKSIVDPNQTLLFGELSKSEDSIEIPEYKPLELKQFPPKAKGRKKLSDELESTEIIIKVPEELKVTKTGEQLVFLGFETSEKIGVIPAKLMKVVFKREKWGYKDSREVVVVAEMPEEIVNRGKFHHSLINMAVHEKFFNGMPLHRFVKNLNSMGADISESTLSDAVINWAKLYEPLAEAIRRQIFYSTYVHADETPLKFPNLNEKGKKSYKNGYVFAYADGNQVYYHYGGSRSKCEIANVLKTDNDTDDAGFLGYLMCDGYSGYSVHAGKRLACWSHVRRKYFNHARDNKNALEILTYINKLYHVEKALKVGKERKGWTEEVFYGKLTKFRKRVSKKILDKIYERIMFLKDICSPKSTMGEAISYTLKRWESLCIYIENGKLPIDNNVAERTLRTVVIGRKNFLFAGSKRGGDSAAVCYSIIESCRTQGIDPRAYMKYVTPYLLRNRNNPEADYSVLTPLKIADKIKNMPIDLSL